LKEKAGQDNAVKDHEIIRSLSDDFLTSEFFNQHSAVQPVFSA
jgi:hypothetical protein